MRVRRLSHLHIALACGGRVRVLHAPLPQLLREGLPADKDEGDTVARTTSSAAASGVVQGVEEGGKHGRDDDERVDLACRDGPQRQVRPAQACRRLPVGG